MAIGSRAPIADGGGASFIKFDDENRELGMSPISKAALAGDDPAVARSNLIDTDKALTSAFGQCGTLEPSLRPLLLVRWYQLSSVLQQLVSIMTTNVVGTGWRLEPALELDSEDGWQTVRASMMLKALRELELEADDDSDKDIEVPSPSDAEVTAEVEKLKDRMWREKAKAKKFLRNVNAKFELEDLLEAMDIDREDVGWGVMEMLRDGNDEPARLNHEQSWTFRGFPLDEAIETDHRVQLSDVHWDTEKDYVRFRRYAQVSPTTGQVVYFKEYGDPRTVSAKSGKPYEDVDSMIADEGKDVTSATELVWWSLPNPESSIYGLPRWSGNINSVVGSHHMETVNILFFRNKAIPPLVVMVSGGHLAAGVKEEIKVALRDHIKGVDNFHGVLVIEAEPSAGGSPLVGTAGQNKVKVEFKPLTEAFFTDQLFGEYDIANMDKVRLSFRIPKLLMGNAEKDNRATAEAVLRTVESQVFEPDRRKIERPLNRMLLDLGVTLWKVRLQAPALASTLELLERIEKLVETILTPAEGREIAASTLGIDFDKLEGDWLSIPTKLFLNGVRPQTELTRIDDELSSALDNIADKPVETQ